MALSTISGTTGITDATITSAKLADFAAAVDLNGVELILDADQDTSITADTDDRIDFKIANVEHFSFSNSSGDTIVKPMVDAKDIKFQQFDGRTLLDINDGGFVGIENGATGPGVIRIFEDSDLGSNYVGLSVGNVSTAYTLVFPNADGSSGQVMTTNGSGVLSFADASANTPSSADGQALGSASLEWSDLFLADSSTIQFGNDQDTILTHTDGAGLTLNSTNKLMFNDASQFIQGASATILDIAATDEIELTATLIEVVGNATVSGTLGVTGIGTFTDDIIIGDGKTIGSASDVDAIAIGSDGDITLTQDLELQHDGAILSFGANDEVSLTHVHNTGILLNSTNVIQFNDASQNIGAPSNAILDINATDEIELNATLVDVNANLDVSGTIVGASTLSATTGTFSGILKTDDATEATSTTDGSLQTDGGLSVVKDAVFGNDVDLLSDGAILNFGADKDVVITHVADTGLTISSAQATAKELLTLESTQAGANGPFIKFNHNTSSPADDDIAGALDFYNNDDGGNSTQVGKIEVKMTDASNNSENSIISFSNNVGGTVTEALRIHEDGTVELQRSVASDSTAVGLAIGKAQKDDKRLTVYGSHSSLSGIAEFQSSNGSGDAAMILFTDGSNNNCGEITLNADNNTVAYSTSSDYRLKENASAISDGITRVKQLKPYRFNFKKDPDKTLDGFFAHEAQAVVPESVNGTKDATKTVNNVVLNADGTVKTWGVTEAEWTQGKTDSVYASNSTWEASKSVIDRQGIDQSKIVPLLTAALKESIAKIEALEARVTTLEG